LAVAADLVAAPASGIGTLRRRRAGGKA
jgi:hypothetical protein